MDKDTIEVNGLTFAWDVRRDEDMREPWKENDGHGIVSEWTTREKKPGERVLAADRGSRRFYDVAGTMEIALKDGWGIAGGTEGMTKRQIAAAAVDKDYEHLKAWCSDEWYWVGVIVTLLDVDGNETNETESLWGMESDDEAYLKSEAVRMAESIAERIGDDESLCVRIR